MTDLDDETWLVDTAADLIERRTRVGPGSLTPLERLTYCLWLADYAMRNTGDLSSAFELHPAFLDEGKALSLELRLPRLIEAFSLSRQALEQRYYSVFGALIEELRKKSALEVMPHQM